MLYSILFWLYTALGVTIINLRADSAFFHEWEDLTGRHRLHVGLYLVAHLLGLLFLMFGFLLIYKESDWGAYFGLTEVVIAGSLLYYHRFNVKNKVRDEYSGQFSRLLLWIIGLLSIAQLSVSLWIIIG